MADDLYGLPLSEFTPARNALAKELAREGGKDEAKRIKALRKPNVPAWLVNQVTRRSPKESKALLRAGERLRKAQEKALAGGAGRDALERAIAAERAAVEDLVEHARKIAAEEGRKVSDANLARVQSTLHAVSLDPEVREQFEAGELFEDREATGVDTLALLAPAGAGRAAKNKKDSGAASRKRVREAEAAEKQVEEELDAAQRELVAAQERVKQLEGKLARARKAVERSRGS